MISVPCPACGRLLTFPASWEGHTWLCPHCHHPVSSRAGTAAPLPSTREEPGVRPLTSPLVMPPPAEEEPRTAVPQPEATAGTAFPTVPGYEILGVLGRGGMGIVYQARQVQLKRLVALKMILSGAHAAAQELARFRVEAEAVARLQHPNIVQIYEIGAWRAGNLDLPMPFFSLEYVDGGSLDKKLAGTPLPPRDAAALLETLARAMHVAHQQGVVHRDLKPANVLLTLDGQPKITDFGLAKQLDSDQGQTQSGAVLGTPSYMAPEQALGEIKKIGPATDVYALGALLYECLTGQPPFRGTTAAETILHVISREPIPPGQLQPKLARDLETICLKCLAKEPHRRYPSAAALAEDLHRFLNGEAIAARRMTIWGHGWRWLQRPERIRDAGVIMLLIAVVRGGLAIPTLVNFISHVPASLHDREAWGLLVFALGICVVQVWAGARALQRHLPAVWAGFCMALVYLGTKLPYVWMDADPLTDPQAGMSPAVRSVVTIHGYLFGIQLVACLAALLAGYSNPDAQAKR